MNIFYKRMLLSAAICVFFDAKAVSFRVIAPDTDSGSTTVSSNDVVNIVYITNRQLLDYTFASLLSVLENSTPGFENSEYKGEKRQEHLNFNLIVDEQDGNATMSFMNNLGKSFSKKYSPTRYNYSISYTPSPLEESQRVSQLDSYVWSKAIFLKLLVSRFLPFDKCLYLDTDTICINDIRRIWNVDLGTHCIGACEHQDSYRPQDAPHIEKVYNKGVLLMDLKKMRNLHFSYGIEKLIKKGQAEKRGRHYIWFEDAQECDMNGKPSEVKPLKRVAVWYTDEYALLEYSMQCPQNGVLVLEPGFNVCGQRIPRDFSEADIITAPLSIKRKGMTYELNRFDAWKSNLAIIHYYYWDENDHGVWKKGSKPWQYSYIQQYKYAGLPGYRENSYFWEKHWLNNKWSFYLWYKYYNKFIVNISQDAYENISKMSLLPEISLPSIITPPPTTSSEDNAVNIVYVADLKYFDFTFVSILSILKNSPPQERKELFRFNIIVDEPYYDGTFNEDKIKQINAFYHKYSKNDYKYDLFFLHIPYPQKKQCLQFVSYAWPNTIFLKLFFSNFLPYERCLYLDGDTLCLGNILDIWNVDLGTHCFGACEHHSPFVSNGIKIYNAGVILMDLAKMRKYNFSDICEKLIMKGQMESRGYEIQVKDEKWYTEETPMFDYSEQNASSGVLELNLRFNMCAHHIPHDYDGKSFSGQDEDKDVPITSEVPPKMLMGKTVQNMREWLSQIMLIHYYYWESLPSKPWHLDRLAKYRKAGCPSYTGDGKSNAFWKDSWIHNPWSFVQWYKYFKELMETRKK
ncbi:MAG: hypothetical protein LBT70_01920 [Holosporaceae bacterium]|nr:hypothetical protein [Holosporaceae bacterium]